MSKLRPIDDKVLVEIEKKQKKTSGGIQLPDEYINREQMKVTTGKIVALADLAFHDLKVNGAYYPKVGEDVFFKTYSGILISDKKEDKEYRIVSDIDIYCEGFIEE